MAGTAVAAPLGMAHFLNHPLRRAGNIRQHNAALKFLRNNQIPHMDRELLKLLPLAPPTCKRFLAVLAALTPTGAAGAAPHDLRDADDFGDSAWKIAVALVIIAMTLVVSLLTWKACGGEGRADSSESSRSPRDLSLIHI